MDVSYNVFNPNDITFFELAICFLWNSVLLNSTIQLIERVCYFRSRFRPYNINITINSKKGLNRFLAGKSVATFIISHIHKTGAEFNQVQHNN